MRKLTVAIAIFTAVGVSNVWAGKGARGPRLGLVPGDGGCVRQPPPMGIEVSIVDGVNLTTAELQRVLGRVVDRQPSRSPDGSLVFKVRHSLDLAALNGLRQSKPTTVTVEVIGSQIPDRTRVRPAVAPRPVVFVDRVEVRLEQRGRAGRCHVQGTLTPIVEEPGIVTPGTISDARVRIGSRWQVPGLAFPEAPGYVELHFAPWFRGAFRQVSRLATLAGRR